MFEINYIYVNTIVISMITIVAEAIFGFIGFRVTYPLFNKPKRKLNESTFSSSFQSSLSVQTSELNSRLSKKDHKIEQFYNLQISIKYILAYICFNFTMLFIIYYFRSIIKLYTFIYVSLIVFISFIYQHNLIAHTINLFRSIFSSIFSSMLSVDKTEQTSIMIGVKKITFILIYSLNLIISLIISYSWYKNRLNGCFWFYHNLIGILICVFCVSVLRLINFRQIFIIFSLFTILDLFFVNFSKVLLNGVSLMDSIAKEHFIERFDKRQGRGLNIVEEELDVDHNVINVNRINHHLNNSTSFKDMKLTKNQNLEQFTIYRIPSIFFIPKINLIDAINECVNLKSTTIIGFGDLIIAGIIASYCIYFDRIKKTKFLYFLTSITSSLVGLILMMLINDLFKANGQPVLLFIVPINFTFLISLSFFREEFNEFWFKKDESLYSTVNQEFAEDVV